MVWSTGWVVTRFWTTEGGPELYTFARGCLDVMDKVIGITPALGSVTPIKLATSSETTQPQYRGKYFDRYTAQWFTWWMANEQLREGFWKQWEADSGVEASFQ